VCHRVCWRMPSIGIVLFIQLRGCHHNSAMAFKPSAVVILFVMCSWTKLPSVAAIQCATCVDLTGCICAKFDCSCDESACFVPCVPPPVTVSPSVTSPDAAGDPSGGGVSTTVPSSGAGTGAPGTTQATAGSGSAGKGGQSCFNYELCALAMETKTNVRVTDRGYAPVLCTGKFCHTSDHLVVLSENSRTVRGYQRVYACNWDVDPSSPVHVPEYGDVYQQSGPFKSFNWATARWCGICHKAVTLQSRRDAAGFSDYVLSASMKMVATCVRYLARSN
jgi:hypothetical protein